MRDIGTDLLVGIEEKTVYPVLLIEADFDSGPVRLWNGAGTLTVAGTEYLGSGKLLRIEIGEETSAFEARNAIAEFSGVLPEDVSVALAENYRGRPARILFGLFRPGPLRVDDDGQPRVDDEGNYRYADSGGEFVAGPTRLFSGRMDQMTINPDPDAPSIILSVESDMVQLNRTRERRFTHEDQQIDYPGDDFFNHVPSMQDRQLVF